MDADLKEKVETLYRDMVISFTEAVRIFAKQSIQENRKGALYRVYRVLFCIEK